MFTKLCSDDGSMDTSACVMNAVPKGVCSIFLMARVHGRRLTGRYPKAKDLEGSI